MSTRLSLGVRAAAALLIPVAAASAEDPAPPDAGPPAGLAARVLEIVDAVRAHHVAPPGRAELIAGAIRPLIVGPEGPAALPIGPGVPGRLPIPGPLNTRRDLPAGLAARLAVVETPEQLDALLREHWPEEPLAGDAIELVLDGFQTGVPGGVELLTDRERTVLEQFAGNRYVGLQISVEAVEGATAINTLFEGGPAQRAGLRAGDRFERIDGEPVLGLPINEVVERLRGEEGTTVTVVVRHPEDEAPRTLEVRRETLPQPTLSSGGPELGLPSGVGLIRVHLLAGSTLFELRKQEGPLRSAGAHALILDLRGVGDSEAHHALLIADELLDAGPIGSIRSGGRVVEHRSGPDCLFRGWPMAVLVDGQTSGPAEWLAAALKDRGRAILVGLPTAGLPFERTDVPLPGGDWLRLWTGELLRLDGRPMREADPDSPFARLRDQFGRPRAGDGLVPDEAVDTSRILADRPAEDPAIGRAATLLLDPVPGG